MFQTYAQPIISTAILLPWTAVMVFFIMILGKLRNFFLSIRSVNAKFAHYVHTVNSENGCRRVSAKIGTRGKIINIQLRNRIVDLFDRFYCGTVKRYTSTL